MRSTIHPKKLLIAAITSVTLMAVTPGPTMAQEALPSGDDGLSLPLPPSPDRVPGEPDVGPAVSPLRWGQKAPFTGVLLSPEAIAKIIADVKATPAAIEIEVQRERKVQQALADHRVEQARIVADADRKVLEAQLEFSRRENTLLLERLEEVESDQPNMALWVGGAFVGGVVVTLVTTLAAAYAAGAR